MYNVSVDFIFFTDTHIAGETPRHRLDDFPVAILAKLREVYSIASERKCRFVACGGDFFNSHRIFDYDLLASVMDVIDGFDGPTYMTVGEHDLYGHNLDTFKTSALAFVARRCPKMVVLFEPVVLDGWLHLSAKHEPDNIREFMARPVLEGETRILLCHELLAAKKYPYDIVETASIGPCPYGLVLSGDLHDGYEIHEANGTVYANPGSLARRTIADAWRMPQVVLGRVERGKKPVVEFFRLKCAEVGKKVFDPAIEEAVGASCFDDANFVKEVLGFEAESVDIHELVQKVGRASGVQRSVLEYLATKRKVG